jgi:EAL domain-containing protein (putative c-di-GMP-specific phosphodiesterase class I)
MMTDYAPFPLIDLCGSPPRVSLSDWLAFYKTAPVPAKAKGTTRHEIFDTGMSAPVLDRIDLDTGRRPVISRPELRLQYQPILRSDTGTITEVEALLRWQHAKHALFQPGSSVGLTEACRQARVWQLEFPSTPPLVMSVNLSAKQFQNPSLVQEITQALHESGLDAASLKLEITEGVPMQDAGTTLARLKELKNLGIRVAIDDSGTGHSSLTLLRTLPIDRVKIDRSFIKDIMEQPRDAAIVANLITMAKDLGIEVVAEGVETPEQARKLLELGCHRAQGYLWAKALPLEDLETRLHRQLNLPPATPIATAALARAEHRNATREAAKSQNR